MDNIISGTIILVCFLVLSGCGGIMYCYYCNKSNYNLIKTDINESSNLV